jgi:hypothetical protein
LRARNSTASRVLPIPMSPGSRTTRSCWDAARRSDSSSASSRLRPTSRTLHSDPVGPLLPSFAT